MLVIIVAKRSDVCGITQLGFKVMIA